MAYKGSQSTQHYWKIVFISHFGSSTAICKSWHPFYPLMSSPQECNVHKFLGATLNTSNMECYIDPIRLGKTR